MASCVILVQRLNYNLYNNLIIVKTNIPYLRTRGLSIVAPVALLILTVLFQLSWLEKGRLPKAPSPTGMTKTHMSEELIISLSRDGIQTDKLGSIHLDSLKSIAKNYIDNNKSGRCDYCMGPGDDDGSADPKSARIVVVVQPGVLYANYASVQNELRAAYRELQQDMALRVYGRSFDALDGKRQYVILRSYPENLSFEQVAAEWVATSD